MPLLQIDIEARYAKFQDALSTIERDTKRTASKMSRSFDGVKATLAGMGAALSVGALVGVVKNAIDAADHLNDLSKQTGVAVDTLGGLGFAAGQAGGNLESIADAAGKLNKSIAGAAGGNQQFADAFKALGININDAEGRLKTVDQVMVELANSFEGYADGPEKVAIATRLLGKAGAEQIALLNEGGRALQQNIEYYKRYSGVTQETADKADAFNDSLGKLSQLGGSFGRTLAAELLPTLQGVAGALLEAKENGDQFTGFAVRGAEAIRMLAIAATAGASGLDDIAIKVGFAGRVLKNLVTLSPGEIAGDWEKYNDAVNQSSEVFSKLYATLKNPPAPDKFEAIVGTLNGQIKGEQDLLATRNQFLQKYNDENLLSDKRYYKAKEDAQKEASENTKKLYDQQIAVLMSKKQFAKTDTDAGEIQGRIDDLHKKKALVGTTKQRAPILSGAGGAAPDPSIRILDAKLKAMERQSQAEQQLLATRSDFLQTYYQDDLLSIGEYYDGLRSAQAEALAAQESNINKEIALLRGRKPKDAREGADRDSKISDLEDRKTALQTAAGRDGIKLQLEQDRAAQQFRQTLEDINLELMEQQGLLPQAAAMRFDMSKGSVQNKLITERDAAARKRDSLAESGDIAGAEREGATVAARDVDLGKLDTLRGMTIAQAKLNSLGDVGYRIQADLSEATERAQIAAGTGSMGELDSLRAVSDARLHAVSDLQQVATAFDDVARATGDPRMVQEARALQLEVDKLAASADLVRERFEDAFTSPFESAIDKLISGTASLKDVFKGLFSDISSELVKMSARDLTKQLFSKNGALGGVVDFTSTAFGGESKVPSASADVASIIANKLGGDPTVPALAIQATAINSSSEALNALTLAAQSAAAAMGGAQTPGAVMPPLAAAVDGAQVLSGVADPEVAGATAEASDGLLDFGKNAYGASADIARLANSAGIGGGALGQLPGIISLFQMAVATMSTTNAATGSGSGIFSSIANLFSSSNSYESAVAATGMFAKGDAFNDGDVIPFAKGGVPSIVSVPTFFPMKSGKTGLMGEAGPEAIMPLARTGAGELAVTMVGDDGKRSLLPVMRDSGGRMAVRAQAQVKAFANGGVFGKGGSLERVAGKSFGLRPGMQAQPSTGGRGGDTHLVVQVTPPAGSSSASANQWGATAGRQIKRSMGRNT